jgi:Ca-activated chloride channel family protein
MKAYDVYPRQLPDLFRGTQLMVLGRYDAGGHRAIKLSGTVNGKAREFVYETNFTDTSENSFLPRLGSTRKATFQLDEIRLRGRNQELVDEIVRLGKRYGILTPYTSFLVVEDGADRPMAMRAGGARTRLEAAPAQASGRGAFDMAREAGKTKEAAEHGVLAPAPNGAPSAPATLGFGLEARDDVARAGAQSVVQIEDKTFYRKPDGFLYDSTYDEARDKANVVEIRMFSDEYFALVRQNPRIGRYLANGQPMVILFDGKIYRITKAN